MNFYKHHIGDYSAATAHLSFVEDAAYSRLLRIYYRDEKPLPLELKAVQRLAGARSKDEREAVETVLEEFFTREEDGWHNKRADAEIARANAQAETNRRIAEEREARKRERNQERNVPREEHESCNESSASREPSQTPDTRHQTKPQASSRPVDPQGARADGDDFRPGSDFLPAEVDPEPWGLFVQHQTARRRWSAAAQVLAVGQLRAAIAEGHDPNAVLRWATTRSLADLLDAARRMASDEERAGAEDDRQRPGESLADYSARLNAKRSALATTTTVRRIGHA